MNINDLIDAIIKEIKAIVGDDWKAISSFAKSQGKKLANQATMLATARTVGSLRGDDDSFEFFSQQLEDMTKNFAQSIANLTIVTLEKAWNAIVEIVWGAINDALEGANLGRIPVPALPKLV